MFLRVQPNSRKISYDFIRRRLGRGSVTVLNDSRRYSLGKSAAAAVVSVEISPSTLSARTHLENSNGRKCAPLTRILMEPCSALYPRPYIIFGADGKCQLVAISTVARWNGVPREL